MSAAARTCLAALLCGGPIVASAASTGLPGSHNPSEPAPNRCEGWPRLALTTPPGYCVAQVADASDGLRFPRRLLEISPGHFWIVDMGGWEPRRGRLLAMDVSAGPAQRPTLRVLADRLDRPHGLARGPDGKIYVGEAGSLWRTPPSEPLQREDVVTGLPDDGAHPLKEFVFGDDGRLFVNVGSWSDACRDDRQQQPVPCPEGAGPRPRAAVYELRLGGPGFTLQSMRTYAAGLRNSLALAWVPGVGLLQGENSIDYREPEAPPEKLNLLTDGAHYGWPYCVGNRIAARGYEGRYDCRASAPPLALWPAHAAPLALLPTPKDGAFQGELLAVWHGYREAGHRIVGTRFDARGRPIGAPRDWVAGWSAGQHGDTSGPPGTPAGITLDHAGRLWIVEDRQRAVLMLGRESKPDGAAAP